jgi:proteasome assembly chaperone (PAC2) family protein
MSRNQDIQNQRKMELDMKEIEDKRKRIAQSIQRTREEREKSFTTILEETKKGNKNPLYR